MSWSIGVVGKKEAVVAAVKEQVEQNLKGQTSEQHQKVMSTVVSTIEDLVSALSAGRAVAVESSGHYDSFYCNANISIKTVHLAE